MSPWNGKLWFLEQEIAAKLVELMARFINDATGEWNEQEIVGMLLVRLCGVDIRRGHYLDITCKLAFKSLSSSSGQAFLYCCLPL